MMKHPTIKSILKSVTGDGCITTRMVEIAKEHGTLFHLPRKFHFIWVERHAAGWEHRAFGIRWDAGTRRAIEDNSLWLNLEEATPV